MPKKRKASTEHTVGVTSLARNAPFELAEAFLQKRYGQPFRAYNGFHKQCINNARAILGGIPDPISKKMLPKYDVDEFIHALDSVMQAHGSQRFSTLLDFMGSDPRTGIPYLEGLIFAPPLPVAGTTAYDEWVQQWGKKAISQGLWDGRYMGWDGVRLTPEGPFTLDMLIQSIGQDMALSSFHHYTKYVESRAAGMRPRPIVPISANERTISDALSW